MKDLSAGREDVNGWIGSFALRVRPPRVSDFYFLTREDILVDAIANLSGKTQERRVKLVLTRANIVSKNEYICTAHLHLIEF